MTTDYKELVHSIVREAYVQTGYDDMDVIELSALANLQSRLYMLATHNNNNPCLDNQHRRSLQCLAEYLIDSSFDTSAPNELATLANALHSLARTGAIDCHDECNHLDRLVVENVLHHHTLDCDAVHAAMNVLTQPPLTHLVYDATSPTLRRYEFSIGGNYYREAIISWAQTQCNDGSWNGLNLAQAFERTRIFEADFGSMAGIDNRLIAHRAYRHYSTQPCTTPAELENKYHACVNRWDYSCTATELHSFILKAHDMLSSDGTSRSDRYTLQSVIASAATRLC